MNLMQAVTPYLGKYYSQEWARKHILQQSDEDIEDIDAQISEESTEERWMTPEQLQAKQQADQQAAAEQQQQQQEVQPLANDEDTDATPETDELNQKLRDAQTTVALLKPQKKRSMQDEARYKSAIMTLATNK
jgi:hypothetical protein